MKNWHRIPQLEVINDFNTERSSRPEKEVVQQSCLLRPVCDVTAVLDTRANSNKTDDPNPVKPEIHLGTAGGCGTVWVHRPTKVNMSTWGSLSECKPRACPLNIRWSSAPPRTRTHPTTPMPATAPGSQPNRAVREGQPATLQRAKSPRTWQVPHL